MIQNLKFLSTCRKASKLPGLAVWMLVLAASVYSQILSPCLQTNFKQAPTFALGNAPSSTAVGDFDGDGKPDIATINNGVNVSILRNIGTFGNGNFAPKVDFALTGGVNVIAVEDFDGDGKKDIVTSNRLTSDLSFLRNTSTGAGDISFAPMVTFPSAASGSIAVADFNGDGRPDIVGLSSSNNVLVSINTSTGPGNVNFAAPSSFATGSQPRGIAAGDFDGDGKPDIVTSNNTPDSVSVLRNTTSGALGFAPKVDFSVGTFSGSQPQSVTIADLDGDNKPDIATGNFFSNSITILRNTSSAAGTISFAAKVNFFTGFGPISIVAKDFDGDGKQDLATANFNGHTVSVLRNISSTGSLNFELRKEFGVGVSPGGIAAADFDGDGKADLSNTNSKSNNVSFLQNKSIAIGSISFYARPEFAIGNLGTNPYSIAIGDLDNDGRKDLITANNTSNNFTILRNSNIIGGSINFSPSLDFPAAVNSNPYWVELQDFDGDGKKDVVIANSSLGNVSVFRNTSPAPGTFSFAAPVNFTVGNKPVYISAGDFDNDGKYDIAVVNTDSNNISILRNTSSTPGTISFATSNDFSVNSTPTSLVIADLDGDGKQDIAVTNNIGTTISVFRNLSSGSGTISFAPKMDFTVNQNPYSIAAGDFDGDGKIDIAVTNRLESDGIVSVLRNTSSGAQNISFDPIINLTVPSVDIGVFLGQLVISDIDNNGKDDLIFFNSLSSYISVLRNISNGIGSISFDPRTDEIVSNSTSTLAVDDLDRDGRKDIAFASYNSNNVGILQNPCAVAHSNVFDFDGDLKTDIGIFRPGPGEWWINRSSTAQTFAAQFGSSTDKPTPGDFTGDGKTDIGIFRPSTGEWFVLRSEDSSFFSFPFGSNGDIPIVGDFDGDGKADPTIFRPSTGEWFILKSSGGTIIQTFGTSGDVPVSADYDGDGKSDIAIWRPSDGSWWYQRSSDLQSRVYRFGVSTDKPVQGDYTGDGKVDIAIFRPSTGEWFVQRSEDNSFYSVPFGSNGDLPVPGDYDGDGKFDTAVFRPSTANWFVQRSTAGILITTFGITGDRPIAGAFVP